ncbi:radical SAM protein [[Clostridium] sordellii]|nr:radical SAM protein [[Clostridium] sordellii] [Paeniclostridium sordellii]
MIYITKLNMIDIQITAKCNRKCRYCFGPQNDNIFLSYEIIKEIIDNMIISGIKNISITGGEPTIHPDIERILKYAKENELNISVSTNTDYIKEKTYLLKYIDILGVPIDSYNNEEHDIIRGEGSLYNVINTLEYVEDDCLVDVRIGTVINHKNKYELSKIAKILKRYNCVKVWRIYDELKYGNKRSSQETLSKYKKFNLELKKCRHILLDKEIAYVDRNNRNLGYFIIEPDGNVFMPIVFTNIDIKKYIGNIYKDSFEKLIKIWENTCNINNHKNMIENIFKGMKNNE